MAALMQMDTKRRNSSGIDHVGLFSPALDSIASQYERLGFCLTPQSQHASAPADGGPLMQRGTANRCAMLRSGYIELLAVVDPTLDGLGVPQALARYAGLHIIAFRTEDSEATRAGLQAAGFDATLVNLQRSINTPYRTGIAQFSQVRTPPYAMPEGRVFILRHETPELVWQPEYLSHPNTAVALSEVIVAVADVAEAGERHDRYFGHAGDRRPGVVSYGLEHGRYSLMEPAALAQAFPGTLIPTLPFPAVTVVDVTDMDVAAQVLTTNQISFDCRPGELVVPAQYGAGVTMVFRRTEVLLSEVL